MKVGFDGRYGEGRLTGIGKYIKYLTLGLSRFGTKCVIFYSRPPETKIKQKGIKTVVLKTGNRYYFEQVLLPRALSQEKADLFHAVGNIGIPLFTFIPSVLTVHDIIPLEIKNYFGESLSPFLSRWSYYLRQRISLVKAKRIITISEYVKRILIWKLGVSSQKIRVIRSGISMERNFGPLPSRLEPKKYILNHGGIDIRKNLDGLIKAFAKIHLRFPYIKLVITGEDELLKPKFENLAANLGIREKVVFPGYVKEEVLWRLLKSSACVCYPTLMEGFGLPVLESFAAGVPVISSHTTSIPEIAGDAALLVNPGSEEGIAEAMIKLLSDSKLRSNMIKKGLRQSRKYCWERAVLETLKIYKEVV